MSEDRLTRRRYLGAVGTAVAATGLAGCSGVFGQDSAATDDPATDEFTPTFADDAGTADPAATSSTPGDSPPGTTTGGASAADSGAGGETATAGANPTVAENATSEGQSPYTRVYRAVIDSVVLLTVTTGGGAMSQGGTGQGSGFVYRDNYIVTNAHVVQDAESIEVQFTDGRSRTASVVGTDPQSDLAVVEVEDRPDAARPLDLIEGEPAIGTEVVAVGNPFGLEGSATSGIVSGVNRSIPAPSGGEIPDGIQTDAPVNPGNSGGPLVNLDGQVVGVVSSGGGENLAFAVSAALARRVVPSLIENGEYERAYMGVRLSPVTPTIARANDLDAPRGVIVTEVSGGGPSDGVLQGSEKREVDGTEIPVGGDVIVGMGSQEIDTYQQFSSYLDLQTSPGDTIDVTVLRDGQERTLELTLGTYPDQS